jgi:hypothetical protein
MKCSNCQSSTNKFPSVDYEDYPGWCMTCVHNEQVYRYQVLQEKNAFFKLRDLMDARDEGRITKEDFEAQKKELFTI